ncbi:hypothetical protein N7468_007833 [Penicillium chermesinum]|uniref:Amine oxidase n=1 Tax=Penicillium chermesinum TaxID=63820 RepID=A0A9W9NNL6_9EURO|nr:uncharacterized protein N7468_007833 [Penicillium chermesinum]KAJ5223291.1 hypothetical protein N7468_007833 [Penicillium chermesinum]KAJ6155869.1 hypothetical protein N7470_006435 [Penicillium chermesinum]
MRFPQVPLIASLGIFSAATPHVDVAIIGGGLSGLATAKDLASAGKTFAVLEARDRVGGRVLNQDLPGGGVEELGAQFVGPSQYRALALASELGLKTYKTYNTGNSTFLRNGTISHYAENDERIPPVGKESLLELANFIGEFNEMASKVNVESPWKSPNATALDSITLGSYVKSAISTADARMIIENAISAILSTEVQEPSLLFMLWYTAGAGNGTRPGTLQDLVGTTGFAQDSRIYGGTHLLATRLAKKLGTENIHLQAPVHQVTFENGLYTVKSDAVTVRAKHVVVAMSPPLASRISFSPLLPAGRDQLSQRMPMGAIGKAIAIFPKPWWREQGLNGQALSDTGVIRTTFDSSPANSSHGALMGFIEADQMRKLDALTEDEVKVQVKESLTALFGSQVESLTDILIQRWDLEEFSRGGPVAYGPPGLLTQYGPYLRSPVGNIHFAGTETALGWAGYMDGAISSGERTAAEILKDF